MQRQAFTIFADYFQFYLEDEGCKPPRPERWDEEDVQRRMKAGPHQVVICPERNMTVPVEMEIHEIEPAYDHGAWDHIVECSLDLPTGKLLVSECTGDMEWRFDVAPGSYRVRAFFGALDTISANQLEGDDHYRVVLWPASTAPTEVIKQYGKPAPEPADVIRRIIQRPASVSRWMTLRKPARSVLTLALVVAVLLIGWGWVSWFQFKPDGPGSFTTIEGVLASTDVRLDSKTPLLDLHLEGSPVIYRVPAGQQFQQAFTSREPKGSRVKLEVLTADAASPKTPVFGKAPVVWVEGLQTGARSYCRVEDYLTRQKTNHSSMAMVFLAAMGVLGYVVYKVFEISRAPK